MRDRVENYRWLREHDPVHQGRLSWLRCYFPSHYDTCSALLKDPRFCRDRGNAIPGARSFPVPLPRHLALLADSMINSDDPRHRRQRTLVQKAFSPNSIAKLQAGLDALVTAALDEVETHDTVDILAAYAQRIPAAVIAAMMGLETDDAEPFKRALSVLNDGLSGWTLLRTVAWDLPGVVRFVRELIERKRAALGDDLLSQLISVEEAGDQLSNDELVSLLFLLIIAGYETTTHLIGNGLVLLLDHPEQLALLRAEPERMPAAVEEMFRFDGPVQGTKPCYVKEPLSLQGVDLPVGSMVIPLLGAANRDPARFEAADEFRIDRQSRAHLGLGGGIHFCLGASLARMETAAALRGLLERFSRIELALPREALKLARAPLWCRYERIPLRLRR